MRRRKNLLTAFLLGVILPLLLVRFIITPERAETGICPITVLTENGIVQMDVEKYVVCVLLEEMPGSFEDEALKAQAVAARTFALYKKNKGAKHGNADVCTSAACCQGYLELATFIAKGGSLSTALKMQNAVSTTKGRVVLYRDALIEATYFSSSGGRTEDAQAVWGASVPYLQSVPSIEADTTHISTIGKDAFCEALGLTKGEVYIQSPLYTRGGGIAEVSINGKSFTGMQLRQYLGLRSTCISFNVGEDDIEIISNGYGHRVGLSQYGADAMAAGGSDYKEILTHYYSGVTIQSYSAGEN